MRSKPTPRNSGRIPAPPGDVTPGRSSGSVVLPDPDHLAHAGHRLDLARVQRVRVADDADDGAVGARGLVDVEPVADQILLHGVQRLLGGVSLRDDQHLYGPSPWDRIRSSRRDSSTTRSNRRTMAPSSSGPGLSPFIRAKIRFSRDGS